MEICPYCGLLKYYHDGVNESQAVCSCDNDNDFTLAYVGTLADGEAILADLRASRPINPNTPLQTVRCEGCGRTQQVAPWKIIPCDGYTCAKRGCERNPGFRLPCPGKGPVLILTPDAAGDFWGYTIRDMTPEEKKKSDQALARLLPPLTTIN